MTGLEEWVDWLFGGDEPIKPLTVFQTAARASVIYVVGLLIVRIGKSRMLSRVTPLDVILGFILGSILSRGITGRASLSGTTAAAVTIVFLHWLFTWIALHSRVFGSIMKGHSVLLVRDGEPDLEALARSHISLNDLEGELRQRGVGSVEDVHLAYKERNGDISVVPRRVLQPAKE